MDKEVSKLEIMRHSLAHIMAAAIAKLWPSAQFGVGPVVENGFYYDIWLPDTNLTEADLLKIEKEMRKLISQKTPFEREEVSLKQAIEWAEGASQSLKVELLEDLAKHGTTNKASLIEENSPLESANQITLYRLGDYVDLCRGPHVENSSEVGAFKLTQISGAFWRGDETKQQMQRLYGVAFATQAELDAYLEMLEQAKSRDHRKIGQELDLFCFSNLVGPGLPLYTPRGTIIIDELQKHIERICQNYGFQKVKTPHLAKRELFEISGHATKFADELFSVTSPKNHQFNLKPVQCPHQTQIYASRARSYRDLPIRYMESDRQYRAEKTGEVGGLNRVYAITVEDGHSFCRVDQVRQEVINMVNIIRDFYSSLGLWGNHWVSLSVRDYNDPSKYIGDEKDWDVCENMLQEVSDELGLNAKRCEGEAALYGPKLDFMFKNAIGKEIQIPTVQLDFATPKRFGLVYTDEEGKDVNPVMVHRAVLGSYERFLVLLIEQFAGKFPVWLAPEQVRIASVNQNAETVKMVERVAEMVAERNIRLHIDNSSESVGKKIRTSESLKVPYTVIIGDKEAQSGLIGVRVRKDLLNKEVANQTMNCQIEKFVDCVVDEIHNQSLKTTLDR